MSRTPSSLFAPALISALLTTLMVAGCAGPAPAASPTVEASASASPSETPTPEPPAAAALVTVSAKNVTVTDTEGEVMVEIAYSADPGTSITQLSEALGETPTALVQAGGVCSAETTVSTWGGISLWDPAGFAGGPGAVFTVTVDGPTTVAGVPVVASAGFSVGDALADVTALGGVSTVDYGDWVSVYSDLQVASLEDPEAWGVTSFTQGGTIARFSAPAYFYYDC